jgi:outer membrane protein assembly factor BamD
MMRMNYTESVMTLSRPRATRLLSVGLAALLLSAQSLVLVSCGGKGIDESDPESLFKDAQEDIKTDHYQVALEKLKVVKNKFPYSKYSVEAQLRIADVYFLQEAYADAAAAYEGFRDLHPKHESAPYAMHRIGKSYFNDIPSPLSRDLTSAQKAVDAYNDFLRRYPQAPEAEEARKELNQARTALADKELYIANFYYKRDHHDSARARFQKVISLYPETEAAKEAQLKLAKLPAETPRQTTPATPQ